MIEGRKDQFNNFITGSTIEKFKKIVGKKWGFYWKGAISAEVENLLNYYISVGGKLPSPESVAHARKNQVEKIPENITTSHPSKEVKEVQVINAGSNSVVSKNEVADKESRSKREEKYSGMVDDVISLLENSGRVSDTKYLKDREEWICKRGVLRMHVKEAIKTVTGFIDDRTIDKRIDELVHSGRLVPLTNHVFYVKEIERNGENN